MYAHLAETPLLTISRYAGSQTIHSLSEHDVGTRVAHGSRSLYLVRRLGSGRINTSRPRK